MVRILQYDPQITAEAYSRRQAAERPFESPVAAGLGRLGQALMAREERREPGHQDKTKAMKVLGRMRREEFALLKKQDLFSDLRERWSAKGHVLDYVSRRDETLAKLAKENPRAAQIVAEKSGTLTEDISRRATVIESGHSGQALVADINGAVADAIETVRTDPTQLGAVMSEFRGTLTGLTEAGMDPDATATIIGAAERKITNAAFRQRLKEDPEAAREELAAGEFGDGLLPEETKVLTAQADQAVKVQRLRAEADTKADDDDYRAEFDDYLERWKTGDVEEDDAFAEDAIRARVSPDDFERYFLPRLQRATAIANAFSEIEFLSDTEIRGRIVEARPSEAEALTDAQVLRNRLRDEDPAAFALRNNAVLKMRNAWMRARAEGDLAAAAGFGRKYVVQTLGRQRGMGVAESDLRVLPDDLADAMVANFTDRSGLGPVAWGQVFKTEFGDDNWRIAIADVVRAGLPEGPALLAQMQADDQRPAAAQLWAEFDTKTEDLREALGSVGDEIAREHTALLNDVQSWPGTEPIDPESAQGRQSLRRAYQLGRDGVPPAAAVRRALVEVTLTPEQYAWVKGPAERIGDQEARAIERSGRLAFVMGVDAAAVRSGGETAVRALQEISRMDQLDHGGRERLLLDILGLGANSAAGMELLDAFDRQSRGRSEPAPTTVSEAPPDLIPLRPVHAGLIQELEEFRRLDPAARARQLNDGFDPKMSRPKARFIEDAAGTMAFVTQALLSDDQAAQMYGAMVASEVALVSSSYFVQVELDPEAWANYDRIVREWFQSRAPLDLGPDRASDQFFIEHARELARNSQWPKGEEQIVEFALLISRLSEANDSQAEATIRWLELTVTPRDPQLAEQLVAAARAKRVAPGTALRTPSGGVVFEPGELGDISADAIPYLSNEELMLLHTSAEPTSEAFPGFHVTPRMPLSLSEKFEDPQVVYNLFNQLKGVAKGGSGISIIRKIYGLFSSLRDMSGEVERQRLVYLARVNLTMRWFADPESRAEIQHLIKMHDLTVDFRNRADTIARDGELVTSGGKDVTVR